LYANDIRIEAMSSKDGKLPFVSIVIPMKNEARFIRRCIDSLLASDYPRDKYEIIVVDGGSEDGSVEIVKEYTVRYPNIKLLGGKGINCPAGMNIGIKEAKGTVISKVDAHGYVAPDFLRRSVEHLIEDDNIGCVGGPIRQRGEDFISQANGYARSSIFGVGKGPYTVDEKSQVVTTVQCGTYKKDVLYKVGLFDETLQYGEDEEINWRIIKAGYKILLIPEIKFFYYPRESIKGLFRQYYNYGVARIKVLKKHPDFFRLKHAIPGGFVASLGAIGISAIFIPLFLKVLISVVGIYSLGSLMFSVSIAAKRGWKYIVVLPMCFAAIHFGYGLGTLRGLFPKVKGKS